MSLHRFAAFTATAAATAALGLAALGAAATATATESDVAFIEAISGQGIWFSSRDGAVNTGLAVCSLVDAGTTPLEAAEILYQESELTSGDAAFFVGASIATFCPEYGDLIGA